ncbi:carboxypeptidase regulatory-like domain-containing protein [Calditrichota bacterium]
MSNVKNFHIRTLRNTGIFFLLLMLVLPVTSNLESHPFGNGVGTYTGSDNRERSNNHELDQIEVLIFGDDATDGTLTEPLEEEGFEVTFFGLDSNYDGDPAPDGFHVIVLTDGTNYTNQMPNDGQSAILEFVENGGGLIVTEWIAYEVMSNRYQILADLLPMPRTGGTTGTETYTIEEDHEVTDGLPDTFQINTGSNTGTATDGTVVVTGNTCGDAVVVHEYEDGRVVQFASAGSYNNLNAFGNDNMFLLMMNAINWTSGGGDPDASAEGTITDDDTGSPIEDAIIRIGPARDTTDANGNYSLAEVVSGEGRTVRIDHEDYTSYRDEIDIEIGENEFDFTLIPLSTVAGVVTDAETGDPVEDAQVEFGEETTETDENGEWSINPQEAGEYDIVITADDYTSYTENLEVERGANYFEIEMIPLSRVYGTVTDIDTGDPIEDAQVLFGVDNDVTDENGAWEVRRQEQGVYVVTINANHYYEFQENVEVEQGDNEFEFELTPLATLSGYIIDSETGDSLDAALIDIGAGLYTAETDNNGFYSIIDMEAGDYPIIIEKEGYFDYDDDVNIDERENVIDFELDILSADLTGIVTDEMTEELLFGATITVIDPVTEEIYRQVQTDEFGEYEASRLHDQVRYLVVASLNSYAPSDTEEVTIRWNRDNEQDFALTPIFTRSIQQLQTEQDLETWVECTGIVTQGTNVTDDEITSIYIQDASGYGIHVYDEDEWDPENNINRSDEVTVTGFLVEEDDVTMIINFEIEVIGTGNNLPAPLVAGTGEMAQMDTLEGAWVQINGQINRTPPNDGTYSLIVDDGSGQCEVRIYELTGIDLTDLAEGDWGSFRGVLALSRQGVRIVPNLQVDAHRLGIDPPDNLSAETEVIDGDTLELKVTLAWNHDHILSEWMRFKIYRDGEHIGNTQDNTWGESLLDPNPGTFDVYTYEYEVSAVYDEGETAPAEIDVIWDIHWVGERLYSEIPIEWALEAVYPNPFNPELHVVIAVPVASDVMVEMVDILGRRVDLLHNGELSAAYHRLDWNASNYPTGLYFIRVSSAAGFNQVSKVMYIK